MTVLSLIYCICFVGFHPNPLLSYLNHCHSIYLYCFLSFLAESSIFKPPLKIISHEEKQLFKVYLRRLSYKTLLLCMEKLRFILHTEYVFSVKLKVYTLLYVLKKPIHASLIHPQASLASVLGLKRQPHAQQKRSTCKKVKNNTLL